MYYGELDPKEFPKYLPQPVARMFWIGSCIVVLLVIGAAALLSMACVTYQPGFSDSFMYAGCGLVCGGAALFLGLHRVLAYKDRVLSGYYFVFWRDAEDGWEKEFATTGILPKAKFAITDGLDFAALPQDDRTRLFISSIASKKRVSFFLYPKTLSGVGRIWQVQYINAVAIWRNVSAISVLVRDSAQNPMVISPLILLDHRNVLLGTNFPKLIGELLTDAAKMKKLSEQCAELEVEAQNHYDRFRYAACIILGVLNVLRDRRIIPSSRKILPWRIRIAEALLRLMPDNSEHNQLLIEDKTEVGAQSISDELRDALLSPPFLRHTWDRASVTAVGSDTILAEAHRDYMCRFSSPSPTGETVKSAPEKE